VLAGEWCLHFWVFLRVHYRCDGDAEVGCWTPEICYPELVSRAQLHMSTRPNTLSMLLCTRLASVRCIQFLLYTLAQPELRGCRDSEALDVRVEHK